MVPLLAALPWIDEVLSDEDAPGKAWWHGAWRLSRVLRSRRFDLAVVSNPKKRLHLSVWLAGVPRRVGYHRKWGWLLTHRLPDRKALGDRHEVEYNLDLIRALGASTVAAPWPLPIGESSQALRLLRASGIGESQPFIAVHPWSSNPLKVWPLERYQELIRLLVERLAAPVVLIGGEEHSGQSRVVLPNGTPAIDLVGRLSLNELAGVLQRARLLVSNDSGPVHLASAVGLKTVVLFGTPDPATGPVRWGPWGAGHTVIWKPSMDAIGVEEVFAAVRGEWG